MTANSSPTTHSWALRTGERDHGCTVQPHSPFSMLLDVGALARRPGLAFFFPIPADTSQRRPPISAISLGPNPIRTNAKWGGGGRPGDKTCRGNDAITKTAVNSCHRPANWRVLLCRPRMDVAGSATGWWFRRAGKSSVMGTPRGSAPTIAQAEDSRPENRHPGGHHPWCGLHGNGQTGTYHPAARGRCTKQG